MPKVWGKSSRGIARNPRSSVVTWCCFDKKKYLEAHRASAELFHRKFDIPSPSTYHKHYNLKFSGSSNVRKGPNDIRAHCIFLPFEPSSSTILSIIKYQIVTVEWYPCKFWSTCKYALLLCWACSAKCQKSRSRHLCITNPKRYQRR